METTKALRAFCALCVSFVLAGCVAAPALAPYPSEREGQTFTRNTEFARKIDRLLPDSLFPPSNIALLIGNLDDRSILYARNADFLYNPASNQKLFTAATALAVLGPAYSFATVVALDTLQQTIYLRGSGDPLLTPGDLGRLADTVALYVGPYRAWTIDGDATRFDTLYWGPGWMWDDADDPSGMGVSALTVNSNTVDVHVAAGDSLGTTPRVFVVPSTSYVRVINESTVVDSVTRPLRVSRPLQIPSNVIRVAGELRRDAHRTLSIAVHGPERFATTLLAEALVQRGVRVAGTRLGTMPPGAFPVAKIEHALDTVLTYMDKVSDNLSAECLTKTLSFAGSGTPGNWTDGTGVIRKYLEQKGIDTTKITVADGSGLSRYNLTSARTIFQLLSAAYHDSSSWPFFYHSLPIAGRDGTLDSRMRGTPAQDRVHAKTGTIAGVSTLSGIVDRSPKPPLGFSLIMENFPTSSHSYRDVQDSIVCLIVSSFGSP